MGFEVFRKEAQKIYEKLVRVTCFASGVYDDTNIFLNPLMWAHYADGYKGICIEYDAQELVKHSAGKLGPIIYRNNALSIETTDDIEFLKLLKEESCYKGKKATWKNILHEAYPEWEFKEEITKKGGK